MRSEHRVLRMRYAFVDIRPGTSDAGDVSTPRVRDGTDGQACGIRVKVPDAVQKHRQCRGGLGLVCARGWGRGRGGDRSRGTWLKTASGSAPYPVRVYLTGGMHVTPPHSQSRDGTGYSATLPDVNLQKGCAHTPGGQKRPNSAGSKGRHVGFVANGPPAKIAGYAKRREGGGG